MFADYHVHTDFSEDCTCPMETMIHRAITIGMDEIAFTEHIDYGVSRVVNCDCPSYFDMLDRVTEEYAGRINIVRGMEFGVQTHTIPLYEEILGYPYDFIILSNHQVNNQEFWNQEFQRGKTQNEFYEAYYHEIDEVIKRFNQYSVLGHLDLIRRYDQYGEEYPEAKSLEMVEPILRRVIEDGKGIEVNTSCFRYGLKDLTPSKSILRLYRDLGGTVLTIGSDAHQPEYLGAHFDEVKELLHEIGFRYFCTYREMEPEFHRL